MSTRTLGSRLGLLTLIVSAGTTAMTEAQTLGLPDPLEWSGAFVEATVPDAPGTIVSFLVYGADGGDVRVVRNNGSFVCGGTGGQGASVEMTAVIGPGMANLRPGGTLRYIVGQRGGDSRARNEQTEAAAGGGGGTGLIYRPTDGADWEFLAVAGGGGGAATEGASCNDFNGVPGQTDRCGSAGNGGNNPANGGCDGAGGEGAAAGGGGGAALNGGNGRWLNGVRALGGVAGGQTGGAGGIGPRLDDNTFAGWGGWGYGGGGGGTVSRAAVGAGGGGGGGYSGGAGGNNQVAGGNGAGGGGGSLFSDVYGFNVVQTNTSPGFGGGLIRTSIVGQVHDTPLNPIILSASQTKITGSTIGATGEATDICLGAVTPIPDVWYYYENTTNVDQLFFLADGVDVDRVSIVANDLSTCILAGQSSSAALVASGEAVFVQIASSSSTFSIDLSISEVDSDGDGVPDSQDQCPGFDDSIDIDSNGIPDSCEDCDRDGVPNGLETLVDLGNATALGSIGTAGTSFTLTTCDPASELNTHLILWDDQGTAVQSQIDDPFCTSGFFNSTLEGTFPAGTYYLGVAGAGILFGLTDFEASFSNGQCPSDGPYVLRVGPSGSETALPEAMLNSGNIDIYSFVINASSPCLADANSDGVLTPADFNAWVLAFNNSAPECDQNDDGQCTPADFNAWVLNYNSGC